MKLADIFESVGLTREQIRAVARGQTSVLRTTDPIERPRPHCLVCGQRINKYNCKPHRQRQLT